jgi:3-methylcrotonyl-CoA carboxylase alpha subunit
MSGERTMCSGPTVTQIGDGVYLAVVDGRAHVVYVAGPDDDRWVHVDGQVFRRPFADAPRTAARAHGDTRESLAAPMPATVLKVLVSPGDAVRKGDTLVVLEAMKMELPIRSSADTRVRRVMCREGELVQAGAELVELD